MRARVSGVLLALLVVGCAAMGPDNFPDGCGVLTELQPGQTCQSLAEGLGLAVADLEALDSSLDCGEVTPGDYICTSGPLANCGNEANISQGDSCEAVATANRLSLNQLMGLNPQLSADSCDDLGSGSACVPSPQECSGVVYAAKQGDTCDRLADKFGLSCAQLTALNPDGFDDAGAAANGTDLCIGCPPQPTCGIKVSPALSAVLNANLNLCAIFASCQGSPSLDYSGGAATLLMSVKVQGAQPAQLRITPNAFPGGDGLFQFTNLVPELLQLIVKVDLSNGVDVSVGGLNISLLNGRPLISSSGKGVLGSLSGGRKLLQQRRRLQSYPGYYGPVGVMRVPMIRYY